MRRRAYQLALIVLVAAAVVGVYFWPHTYQGYEASLALLDLIQRPAPSAVDFRPNAVRSTVSYEIDGRQHVADLYQPARQPQAGIVFIPGAAPGGKDDPRVRTLGTLLARSRFVVLVPDIVALRQLRLVPESARDVADALTYMFNHAEFSPGGRVGMLTTSVAIGPGLLATLDPSFANRVHFFVSVGGYYDLARTLIYLTTGYYNAEGITVRRAPQEYGKWIYALSNAARLEDPAERAAFTALALKKLEDPAADVSGEVTLLGESGRKIYDFITNTDPARSRDLLERLPSTLRADVTRLSLATHDLSRLSARFILVHGTDDQLIPYGESIALSKALPRGQVRLFVLKGIRHVDVAPAMLDGLRLWQAFYALLSERRGTTG